MLRNNTEKLRDLLEKLREVLKRILRKLREREKFHLNLLKNLKEIITNIHILTVDITQLKTTWETDWVTDNKFNEILLFLIVCFDFFVLPMDEF